MITLIKQYYTIIHKKNNIFFDGTLSTLNNNIIEVFGPINHNRNTIGSLISSFSDYIVYLKEYELMIIEFIDNLKQELKNMGYVIEC